MVNDNISLHFHLVIRSVLLSSFAVPKQDPQSVAMIHPFDTFIMFITPTTTTTTIIITIIIVIVIVIVIIITTSTTTIVIIVRSHRHRHCHRHQGGHQDTIEREL